MPISALGGSLLGLLLGVMLGLALYAFLARPGEVTRASLIASVSEAFPEPLATGIDDEAIGASCGRRTRARWRCELSDASGGPSVYERDGYSDRPGRRAERGDGREGARRLRVVGRRQPSSTGLMD